MKKPEKPHKPIAPAMFTEALEREQYTLEDLEVAVANFANKHDLDPSKVLISWDEGWTGYEDYEVSLELRGVESERNFTIRKEIYESNMEKFKEDSKVYAAWFKEEEERKARLKQDKILKQKKEELKKLQKEIEYYEKNN